MKKAPLFVALAIVGTVVAVDQASMTAGARGLGEQARGLWADVQRYANDTPAPVAAKLEPEVEEYVVDPVGAPDTDGEGPAGEPTAMADDWGELDDQQDAPAEVSPEEALDEADGHAEADAVTAEDDGADSEQKAASDGPPVLVSTARETWVFSEPRWRSRRLGYLRAGATVTRTEEVVSKQGCKRGWYRVEPHGYVCINKSATTDPNHPVAQLSQRRPDLGRLPYTYTMSRFPTPPLYARLPSEKQQKRVEPERNYHLRKYERLKANADFVPPPEPEEVPPLLADGKLIPPLGTERRGKHRVLLRKARVRSGFALLGTYERDGRQFGLTTELAAIPLDRTRIVQPSTFQGVVLSDELTLPVGIVRSKFARRYHQKEGSNALAAGPKLQHRSVLALTGKVKMRGEHHFYEARDGSWVRADRVVRINRFKRPPKWATQGKKWIDVSILKQALVAYEGERPVYATLVSTGADGIQDHEKTHATIQGTFLIHTKHVSVTMDGDERGDEFDLRDVPYVQYFTEGYALHGAYWHDDFGTPRSHGCVNLAPLDAAWLFGWTTPDVPKGWHASLSLKKGTIVYIHP